MASSSSTESSSTVHGRNIEKMRCPEVLFPNKFISRNPWDDPAVPQTAYFPDNPLPATIPIRKLVHITHPTEALSIEEEGDRRYKFIPKIKCGKSYEDNQGGGHGITYVYKAGDENYEEILYTRLVFSGCLSWWGIDVRDGYEGSELQLKVLRNKRGGRYVPGYLAAEPESPYGNVAFSIELSDILRDYENARNIQGARVCLKMGGTLRYRFEICYVVFVCLKDDDDHNVKDMPSIAGPKFVSNGLVDDNGVVIDRTKTPNFKADNIIKSEKAGEDRTGRNQWAYNRYSWEQLVFAFYFPNNGEHLVCTQVEVTREYPHFKQNCYHVTCKNTTTT